MSFDDERFYIHIRHFFLLLSIDLINRLTVMYVSIENLKDSCERYCLTSDDDAGNFVESFFDVKLL